MALLHSYLLCASTTTSRFGEGQQHPFLGVCPKRSMALCVPVKKIIGDSWHLLRQRSSLLLCHPRWSPKQQLLCIIHSSASLVFLSSRLSPLTRHLIDWIALIDGATGVGTNCLVQHSGPSQGHPSSSPQVQHTQMSVLMGDKPIARGPLHVSEHDHIQESLLWEAGCPEKNHPHISAFYSLFFSIHP